MSKLDKNQRIRTSKPKQDFDLSHDYLFTATTGQLRPVTHDVVQAGDYVKGKFNFFLRTMPLSTAAMVDVDFMVDYFFVPMELIWLPFGAWWSQTRSFPFFNSADWHGLTSPQPALRSFPMLGYEDLLGPYGLGGLARDEKYQSLRLLDDLGISAAFLGQDAAIVNKQGDDPVSPSFFPWQICAYNCIYQHFYRNEEREAFQSADYSLESEGTNPLGWTNPINIKMRYLNRMDDYFTASKLSPLVANINNSPTFLSNFDVQLGHNSFGYTPSYESLGLDSGSNSSPNNLVNNGFVSPSVFEGDAQRSVNQLRALFAQEKLLHVMNMTNKNYDSQVLARLGYDVPNDVKHEVMHLGHDTCQLNVQEIVSGSNTFTGETGSALGDLAGQGKAISRDFKGFSFTAPCHGVVMTIWTCRVRPKYTTSMLRKDMMQDITDFFTPELDDLGMQPQYLYETRLVNGYKQQFQDIEKFCNPFTITGWNYRYEYLKRNIDRSSLAFMRGSDGVGQQQYAPEPHPSKIEVGFNSYTQWSSARIPLDNAFKVLGVGQLAFEDDFYSRPHNDLYKVQPNELDNIMLVSWMAAPPLVEDPDHEGQYIDAEQWYNYPWLSYQRDPFIVDGRFECHKRSAMSLYSMPKFI